MDCRGDKMYKIVVCDDEQGTCNELKTIIEKIFAERKESLQVKIFLSGEDLIEDLNNGSKYDLLFLDINLTSINGVEVGKYIRETIKDYKLLITYVSSYESYAMSLFQVQPFEFLIKPVNEESVRKVIDKAVYWYKETETMLEYTKNKALYSVKCNEIVYVYSDRKKVSIVMMNGDKEEFYGKLKETAMQLPENFSMISQSFVINRNYVQKYSYDEVVMMNKHILSISRTYRKAIREIVQRQRRKD